jgi:hypothetical protein
MTFTNHVGRIGRTLALSTALVAAVGVTTVSQPAHALGTGAAVGIGLGAFAVGSALGAAATSPYYGYPYYGYPANYYYPPAPAYYPAPRRCWQPYYGYVAC